jgi:hypothetical protein
MFANERRGLRIVGSNFEYLTEGAYSIVFVNRSKGRVLKVFRATHRRDHSADVFNAEVEAYKVAMKSNDLKALVPNFFGTQTGLKVMDKNCTDVTDEFYPNLAFEAEFIPQRFDKIAGAPLSEQERITKLFRDRGICHMSDVSVVINDGRIQKVIDFAIQEIVPEAEPL